MKSSAWLSITVPAYAASFTAGLASAGGAGVWSTTSRPDSTRGGVEVPAVVGRPEDDAEVVPAGRPGRDGSAWLVLVLVEVLADVAGGVARALEPHVDRAPGFPKRWKAGQPPTGSAASPVSETLVRTPVWWGYCPVKVLARDTQHSESTT